MSDQHYFSHHPTSAVTPREIEVHLDGRPAAVHTSAGVFSPQHIDKGSQVLLDHAPALPDHGHFLDLGCGWGPLALTMALQAPGAQVYGVDVNPRALELTATNAVRLGVRVHTSTVDDLDPALRFEVIWSNPPIRVGKEVLHAILSTWLPRLSPSGEAFLVVQKNLGADSLQRWIAQTFADQGLQVQRTATAKGFRLLRVSREQGSP